MSATARRLLLVWVFIVLITHAWLFLQSPACPPGGLDCMAFPRSAGAVGVVAAALLLAALWMMGRSPWVRALVASAALLATAPAALLAGPDAWLFAPAMATLGLAAWTPLVRPRAAIPAGLATAAGIHAALLLFLRARGEARSAPLALVLVLLLATAAGALAAWRLRR